MTSGQLAALDSNIFPIIAKLKRQSKRADIDSVHAHVIKTLDFEKITNRNLQERINSLISSGKVVNRSNRNKDSYWINLDLAGTTNESTLNLSHHFLPNTPTAAHVNLLSSRTCHPEPSTDGSTPDFNIIALTSMSFRRFEIIEIEEKKTEKNNNMCFQKE